MVQKIKPKCPHCESKEIIKRGYFETQTHGKQQRYFCCLVGAEFNQVFSYIENQKKRHVMQ